MPSASKIESPLSSQLGDPAQYPSWDSLAAALQNPAAFSEEWRLSLTVRSIRTGTYDANLLSPERLEKLIELGLMDSDIALSCANSLLTAVDQKLKACFPTDAREAVRGIQTLAPFLTQTAPPR